MIDTRYIIEGPTRLETMGSYVRVVEARWPKRYVVELAPIDDGAERNYDNDDWGPMEQGPGSEISMFDTYEEAAAFVRLLRTFRDHLDPEREVSDVSVGKSSYASGDTVVSVTLNIDYAPIRNVEGDIVEIAYSERIKRTEVVVSGVAGRLYDVTQIIL